MRHWTLPRSLSGFDGARLPIRPPLNPKVTLIQRLDVTEPADRSGATGNDGADSGIVASMQSLYTGIA